jgi:hypothetical protein
MGIEERSRYQLVVGCEATSTQIHTDKRKSGPNKPCLILICFICVNLRLNIGFAPTRSREVVLTPFR